MALTEHDYIVVFRVQLSTVIDAATIKFPPPVSADVWRFGPENVHLDENGFPNYQSNIWGGIAIYKDYEAAKNDALNPRLASPVFENTKECWSALLLPIAHKGDVYWREHIESSCAIKTAQDDPGGQLAVITSAGFNSQTEDQFAKISKFTTSAEQIRKDFQASSNNLKSSTFYAMHDLLDGITFTLWQSDKDMLNAAYGKGLHGDLIKSHSRSPMVDRISNTRARILLSTGTWGGNDPLIKK